MSTAFGVLGSIILIVLGLAFLIPGIIGPAIGAAVLKNAEIIVGDDGTASFVPNENIFLAAFLAAALIFAVLLPLFRMLKKETNHGTR